MHQLEEAKEYDHMILGSKHELIIHHEWSPGSWFFLPRGARVYNKLLDFIRDQYHERGYQEVISPNVFNKDLWVQSSHAGHYKKDMFVLEIDKQEFGLKPINCPGHCLMFKYKVRSYRELPLRFAEFGVLHRNEANDVLSGLMHTRRFQQDDAHIFCRESQIKDEIKKALNFVDYVYQIFGFTYELKLSTSSCLGCFAKWENAFIEALDDEFGNALQSSCLEDFEKWVKVEDALREALDECGKPWQLNEEDGAFYGAKIDITVCDALSRKFKCGTLQLDFQLPGRFKLEFSTEDEAKIERPVMIHISILGPVERMFAILLEHYRGKWPFWLSPRQVILCTVSEKSQAYAQQVCYWIHQEGYHVDVDTADIEIQKKLQDAQSAQYNYILVVGEDEANSKQVSVQIRNKTNRSIMSIENLLKHFKEEVAAFH